MTPWSALWRHPEFRRGARDIASVSVGLAAWGLVTGIAMIDSGLGVPASLAMTLCVYAGSAQLASLPLIATGAPLWVIWATSFCVNLRFVIFSAQWRPYFADLGRWRRTLIGYFATDLNLVLFTRRYPEPKPGDGQVEYYLGGVVVNWLSWQSASVVGILLARHVPASWGLGFAGVLALLGILLSMLSDRAAWVAAGVASAAAVAAYALPLKLNIVVAIAAAVALGLLMDAPRRTPSVKEGS